MSNSILFLLKESSGLKMYASDYGEERILFPNNMETAGTKPHRDAAKSNNP
jgi:hypothetical protein